MAVKRIEPRTGQEYRLFAVYCKVNRFKYDNGDSFLSYDVVGKGLFDHSEVRSVFFKSFLDPDAALDLVEELDASINADLAPRIDGKKELSPEKMII